MPARSRTPFFGALLRGFPVSGPLVSRASYPFDQMKDALPKVRGTGRQSEEGCEES